jgi:hypothetical protein
LGFSTLVPWTSLKSAPSKLFADPSRLATFSHLDPAQLSGDEAYRLLKLVGDSQEKNEASPLKFSVAVETINALDSGDEIGELTDAPLSPTRTMGPHGTAHRSAASPPPISEGAETAIDPSCSPTKTTGFRGTADHSTPSSEPVSEGSETAIDKSRSPAKTTGLRGKGNANTLPPATADHTAASSEPISEGAEIADGITGASIADQDGDDDNDEPSTVPGETFHY